MILKMLNKHHSIIVLNGTLDHRIFQPINTNVAIIAADGAADRLDQLGLKPDFIVGDGDSYHGPENARRIIIQEQDSTDFEKCIQFATEQHLLPSLVIGINGGEIDHILGNMQALIKHARGHNLYFLDSYVQHRTHLLGFKLGIPLSNECVQLPLRTKCTISLLPFGKALVTTKGLNWELDNTKLESSINSSIRNYNNDNFVKICVHAGKALLIVDITRELSINQS